MACAHSQPVLTGVVNGSVMDESWHWVPPGPTLRPESFPEQIWLTKGMISRAALMSSGPGALPCARRRGVCLKVPRTVGVPRRCHPAIKARIQLFKKLSKQCGSSEGPNSQ